MSKNLTIETANGRYRIQYAEGSSYHDNGAGWYFEPTDYEGDMAWSDSYKTEAEAIDAANEDAYDQILQREAWEFNSGGF
jgi:hypothetical protein